MIEITTPAIVFSVVSLTLLGYSNRFSAVSGLLRRLDSPEQKLHLKKRLRYIQTAMFYGQLSLILAIMSIFFIIIKIPIMGEWIFYASLLSILSAISYGLSDTIIALAAIELNEES